MERFGVRGITTQKNGNLESNLERLYTEGVERLERDEIADD